MLGIFNKELVNAPKELNSPVAIMHGTTKPMKQQLPHDSLNTFLSSYSPNAFSFSFANKATLAFAPPPFPSFHNHRFIFFSFSLFIFHYALFILYLKYISSTLFFLFFFATVLCRLFCGVDDMYCTFLGNLNNLSALNKQYGLSKCGSEAMFVIEAYRTLRDRGPYPAHQVIKDLDGSFGFVLYDTKAQSVFVALSGDGGVKLYWGIASDGSVMISDDLELIKASCAKSLAPFPTGKSTIYTRH